MSSYCGTCAEEGRLEELPQMPLEGPSARCPVHGTPTSIYNRHALPDRLKVRLLEREKDELTFSPTGKTEAMIAWKNLRNFLELHRDKRISGHVDDLNSYFGIENTDDNVLGEVP